MIWIILNLKSNLARMVILKILSILSTKFSFCIYLGIQFLSAMLHKFQHRNFTCTFKLNSKYFLFSGATVN